MADLTATLTEHHAHDDAGVVLDGARESAGSTDSIIQDSEFIPARVRTITDSSLSTDGGNWSLPQQGERAGLTDTVAAGAIEHVRSVTSLHASADDATYDLTTNEIFTRLITDTHPSTDHGSYFAGLPPESAGLTDTMETGGIVTVRTVTSTHSLTDLSDPLALLYGITFTEDQAGFDDVVGEPDSTGPLDYTRTATDAHPSVDSVTTPTSVAATASDGAGPSDTVTYRLRGRVDTPAKRTVVVARERRVVTVYRERRTRTL